MKQLLLLLTPAVDDETDKQTDQIIGPMLVTHRWQMAESEYALLSS